MCVLMRATHEQRRARTQVRKLKKNAQHGVRCRAENVMSVRNPQSGSSLMSLKCLHEVLLTSCRGIPATHAPFGSRSALARLGRSSGGRRALLRRLLRSASCSGDGLNVHATGDSSAGELPTAAPPWFREVMAEVGGCSSRRSSSHWQATINSNLFSTIRSMRATWEKAVS